MRRSRAVALFRAWDEAAYRRLAGAGRSLAGVRAGRSAWFCGGYGLGMAAVAAGLGHGEPLPWLAAALCLFLAGLAHDNEREPSVERDAGGARLDGPEPGAAALRDSEPTLPSARWEGGAP